MKVICFRNSFAFGGLLVTVFKQVALIVLWQSVVGTVDAQEDELEALGPTQPVVIQWTMLGPKELFQDPFVKLSQQQREDLSFIVRVRRLISEKKITPDGDDAKRAEKLAQQLEEQGVDIIWLIMQRDRVRDIRARMTSDHASSISSKYKGQAVSLTGYGIPLKCDDSGRITEFLLVPSLALCSHESPPPANQIVHVHSESGVLLPDSRVPLSVTGTLHQRLSRYPFGISSVAESVYAIQAREIEVIAQPASSKATSN